MVAQYEGQTVLLRADDDHLHGKRREGVDGGCARAGEGEEERAGER